MTRIAGPSDVPILPSLNLLRVAASVERRDAVERALPGSDALIMAAAPSAYTTASPGSAKIIRAAAEADSLALGRISHRQATTRASRPVSCVTGGFALETGDALRGGRHTLAGKSRDSVVANAAIEDRAGLSDRVEVSLHGR